MGGGHFHVQIDVGPVSAYLDAYADFLITYKPFHYIADLGVDVGVSFDADFWIIHIVSRHSAGGVDLLSDFWNSTSAAMSVLICISKARNLEEELMSISTYLVSSLI